MKPERWMVWVVIGLLVLNAALSLQAAIRPVVPVSALTNAIASLGGDARVLLIRVQQLEQALQQAGQENDRLREEFKKVKGGGR